MIKFEEAKKDEAALFGLVGYSFPYKMGCLNLQVSCPPQTGSRRISQWLEIRQL